MRTRMRPVLVVLIGVLVVALVVTVVLVMIRPEPQPRVAAPPPGPRPAPTGPDGSNTGVPAGVALKPSGSLTVSTSGAVISGLDVSGCITIKANDVTIKNTRVRGKATCGGSHLIHTGMGLSGIVIEDVELDGMGVSSGSAVGNEGFTLNRVNIHNVGSDGVYVQDNVVIQNSWIHGLVYESGDHNDTIMTNGDARNIVIKHNRLENPYGQTAVIALFEDFGGIHDVLVEDNLISGGGYSVYAGGNTSMPHSNIRFINNTFTRQFWPKGGQHGPVTALDSTITWTGNTWLDTGQAIAAP